MRQQTERDPALALIDRVLVDAAVRSRMYVARRREDGDDESFVIQTGEEGRKRLALPDHTCDPSIERLVAAVQAHLGDVLNQPVPRCPEHEHALVGTASGGRLTWVCPDGQWRCDLGRYEEMTWPQRELGARLGPILMRRLNRYGASRAVRSIAVRDLDGELVADFGVTEATSELLNKLAMAAAPLPMRTHYSPDVMIRPLSGGTDPSIRHADDR